MCTEMPNLKANFFTFLTKEVNPERPVARPKGIATNWYTLPKSKNLSKSEPNEPKERKEAYREREKKGENGQLISFHPDSLENQEKI